MKILLSGAKGQLGKELTRRLKGTDFFATDAAEMDITDQPATLKIMNTYRPDAVIHCAAYTNVDGAEENGETAYKINAIGAQNVAAGCLQCGAKLVYVNISPASFDQPNPQSIYGKSKLAGEMLTRHILNRLFIVRTSWLYGDGNNFVRTMLKLGKERDTLRVVNDQYGCPTSTQDLAEAILALIRTEHYGIYHAANTGVTTWYDLAKKIFELAGLNRVKVLPQTTEQLARPAPRPLYSPLDNMLLRLTVGAVMRPWEEALKEYLAQQT